MSNKRKIITLGVASATAIIAAVFARDFLASAPPKPKVVVQQAQTAQVLVVTKDLRTGEKLQPAALQWRAWPQKQLLPGMITKEDRPDALNELANKRVRSAMVAGEPLLESKISRSDGGMLASMLGPGMRAFTIRLNPDNFSAAAFSPGDRVDVMFTGSVGNHKYTEVVLENARVLPSGNNTAGDGAEGGAPVSETGITLEVTPRQAAVLARLQSIGELMVTLRSTQEDADGMPRLAPRYRKTFAGEVKLFRYGVPGAQIVNN